MKLAAPKHRTILTVCAAPLLLALAASASSSSDASPAPSGVKESGGVASPTLYPNPTIGYKETPEPVTDEVAAEEGSSMAEEGEGSSMADEGEGSSMGEGEEEGSSMTEEETPTESPGFGGTCTTYDEDVSYTRVAIHAGLGFFRAGAFVCAPFLVLMLQR